MSDVHPDCEELGSCSLKEHKGYCTCEQSGECNLLLHSSSREFDREQRDKKLDDPRRGQAGYINRGRMW